MIGIGINTTNKVQASAIVTTTLAPTTTLEPLPVSLSDPTKTVGWYKPFETGGCVSVAGVESIYYDMVYGSNTLSAEISAGLTGFYTLYKITATQANHFFVGCVIGDLFIGNNVIGFDANNKAQQVLGNHLVQVASANNPTNRVFNGTNSKLKTKAFTFEQPEYIYLVIKPLSWTIFDYFFDGYVGNTGLCCQNATEPNITAYAGTTCAENANLILNQWAILKVKFDGITSRLQVNDTPAIVGDMGLSDMGGFTLGAQGQADYFAHFEFAEGIVQNMDDGVNVVDYLKTKYLL
jgi:hypothetical protein